MAVVLLAQRVDPSKYPAEQAWCKMINKSPENDSIHIPLLISLSSSQHRLSSRFKCFIRSFSYPTMVLRPMQMYHTISSPRAQARKQDTNLLLHAKNQIIDLHLYTRGSKKMKRLLPLAGACAAIGTKAQPQNGIYSQQPPHQSSPAAPTQGQHPEPLSLGRHGNG